MNEQEDLEEEYRNWTYNPKKTQNRSPTRNLTKKTHHLSANSSLTTRRHALMPDGIPRYIRCYDNQGLSLDNYTVCFTGRYRKKTGGEFWFFTMNSTPTSPQGIGMSGSHRERIDYPTYAHLGVKIAFGDLPEACRALIVERYEDLWNIKLIEDKL